MPSFSKQSQDRLFSCDTRLIALCNEVVRVFDCTVLCGFRGKDEQNELFVKNKTKLMWPNSKHNKSPAEAVDLAPYPIDWNDRERFIYFAGYVMGVASQLFIPIRWGGDWNKDWQVKDNKFDDLVHFELDT